MKLFFLMILVALCALGCAPQGHTVQQRQERVLDNLEPNGGDILEKDGEGIYEGSARVPW